MGMYWSAYRPFSFEVLPSPPAHLEWTEIAMLVTATRLVDPGDSKELPVPFGELPIDLRSMSPWLEVPSMRRLCEGYGASPRLLDLLARCEATGSAFEATFTDENGQPVVDAVDAARLELMRLDDLGDGGKYELPVMPPGTGAPDEVGFWRVDRAALEAAWTARWTHGWSGNTQAVLEAAREALDAGAPYIVCVYG
jgi:hypothetical protein